MGEDSSMSGHQDRLAMEPHWTDKWVHWTAGVEEVQKFRDLSDKTTEVEGTTIKEFKWILHFVALQAELKRAELEAGGDI